MTRPSATACKHAINATAHMPIDRAKWRPSSSLLHVTHGAIATHHKTAPASDLSTANYARVARHLWHDKSGPFPALNTGRVQCAECALFHTERKQTRSSRP